MKASADVLVAETHLAQMSRDDRPRKLFPIVLLDELGYFGGSVELHLAHRFLDEVLDLQRFFVFSFFLHGGDEGSRLNFLVGPVLPILVKNRGVAQLEDRGDLLQAHVLLRLGLVVGELRKNLVHPQELLFGD